MLSAFWLLILLAIILSLSLSSGLPIIRDTVFKLGQLITLQWSLMYSSEKKGCMSFTLSKKLEIIMLIKKGILKAKTGKNLDLLWQTAKL